MKHMNKTFVPMCLADAPPQVRVLAIMLASVVEMVLRKSIEKAIPDAGEIQTKDLICGACQYAAEACKQ